MKKRIFSVIVALSLLLGCMVMVPAYADDQEPADGNGANVATGSAIVIEPADETGGDEGSTSTGSSIRTDFEFASGGKSMWYDEAYEWADKNGVIERTGASTTTVCSRADAFDMLWRAAGKPVVNYAMNFSDVDQEAFYAEAVRWAASEGIALGYGDGGFHPFDPVTREQLAAIIYRYAQSKGEGFTGAWMFLLDFEDAAEVSTWADEAMHWCVMKGIIEGMDGKLCPQDDTTYAQTVTMLYRAFK